MIEFSVVLDGTPDRAFTLFTERVSEWWPPAHRLTKDPESHITLSANGAFQERAADGRVADLGRVRTWNPPHRLELDFYLGTGPDQPTDVLVTFTDEGAQTRVTVVHRPLPASADVWSSRVGRYRMSWPVVLGAYQGCADAFDVA